MARASQVQMMAKQMGGIKKAQEAFNDFMKLLESAQKKESKANWWGDVGGIGTNILSAMIAPGTKALDVLSRGALKGGIGGLGKEIFYKLAGGGKNVSAPDFSKFSSSPYGRTYAKELFEEAGDIRSHFKETFAKPGESTGKGALAGLLMASAGKGFQSLFGDKDGAKALAKARGSVPLQEELTVNEPMMGDRILTPDWQPPEELPAIQDLSISDSFAKILKEEELLKQLKEQEEEGLFMQWLKGSDYYQPYSARDWEQRGRR